MEGDSHAVKLAAQLGASALLVVICTMIHGGGLAGITRLFNLRDERLKEHDYNFQAVMLTCAMTLSLFLLHMVEIAAFAAFYLAVGAMSTVQDALHFSASTYATLGRTAEYFPKDWSLMGAIEALIGFLLIGWSTAFIVRNVSKMRS